MKKFKTLLNLTLALSLMISISFAKDILPNALSEESLECLECHKSDDMSLYQQWGASKHYGANVGCYECHQAEEGDADAF